ncbi:MAG: hypothetical protein ACJAU0_001129 [Flavobacteriales bacterium]|jgi:hypothetical protein
MADEILNRVISSGLVSLDLEEILPQFNIEVIDLKDQLWQELMLKEKDFRAWIKETDWTVFKDQHVSIVCTADAIIPTWAYMLVASALAPFAQTVSPESKDELRKSLSLGFVNNMSVDEYVDARIVVKGCSDESIPLEAYTALVQKLQPVAKSLLFGEPCSTVPIYKKPRQ